MRYESDCDSRLPMREMREAFDVAYGGLWLEAESVLRGDGEQRLAELTEAYHRDMEGLRQDYANRLTRRLNHQGRLILQNPQSDFFEFELGPVFQENLQFVMATEHRKIGECSSAEDMFRIICKGTQDDFI